MKASIKIDMRNKKLVMTKTFYNKATNYGTREYNELRAVMNENPGYEIEFKATAGKHYGKLTYKRMEAYIKRQPESKRHLQEFNAVQTLAKLKGSSYPIVKKWFLDTFPDYKETATDAEIAAALPNSSEQKQNETEKFGNVIEQNETDFNNTAANNSAA